jgi:hypothetical protein
MLLFVDSMQEVGELCTAQKWLARMPLQEIIENEQRKNRRQTHCLIMSCLSWWPMSLARSILVFKMLVDWVSISIGVRGE